MTQKQPRESDLLKVILWCELGLMLLNFSCLIYSEMRVYGCSKIGNKMKLDMICLSYRLFNRILEHQEGFLAVPSVRTQ